MSSGMGVTMSCGMGVTMSSMLCSRGSKDPGPPHYVTALATHMHVCTIVVT